MDWRARTRMLLLALAVLLSAKLGQQLYRWAAFGDERAQLRVMNGSLEEAGLTLMQTQLRADSLRAVILGMDEELRRTRASITTVERRARRGRLDQREYERYRARLTDYNRGVEQRNERYQRWRAVVEENHRAVHRYNALADSIRGVEVRMGEPYYAIPTPAELAVRHGLRPPDS